MFIKVLYLIYFNLIYFNLIYFETVYEIQAIYAYRQQPYNYFLLDYRHDSLNRSYINGVNNRLFFSRDIYRTFSEFQSIPWRKVSSEFLASLSFVRPRDKLFLDNWILSFNLTPFQKPPKLYLRSRLIHAVITSPHSLA